MDWLRDTFLKQGNDSTEVRRIRYARAYILEMIGGYLIPDLSRNLIHLRWLLKLIDFRVADELSWGSTMLATLYRKMYGATLPNKAKIGGPIGQLCTVEMYQMARVLQQFGFRQSIPEEPESEYIKIWENRYDHIPDRELIIVPKLACTLNYMPWFRIHGKPYLLSEEQRRRQIRVERERRGPLNSRRSDDDTSPSTAPKKSSGPLTAHTHSLGSIPQPTKLTSQPLQIMLGAPSSPQELHKASSVSSSHYHFLSPYRIQTSPSWVMQTPPHYLFYQGGSSSQHPQPEQPQPLPEDPL
ncbi:hypothetical protein CXB51_023180 [Gossypium anomalum]|uniref:Aminotransferase-like plant mobile domain-containing protein n=1 Tax=Gossypium anomalum TaxID=47600 RepID=A0A8J6CV34_9ROSI|nr:hypothetical protein CXB51_023180 [Gossypium anomalum]